jgi:hypothetical protein
VEDDRKAPKATGGVATATPPPEKNQQADKAERAQADKPQAQNAPATADGSAGRPAEATAARPPASAEAPAGRQAAPAQSISLSAMKAPPACASRS